MAEQEHILTENPGRFVVFPLKYHDIWEMYKTAEHSFWTSEEIDFGVNEIFPTNCAHSFLGWPQDAEGTDIEPTILTTP